MSCCFRVATGNRDALGASVRGPNCSWRFAVTNIELKHLLILSQHCSGAFSLSELRVELQRALQKRARSRLG